MRKDWVKQYKELRPKYEDFTERLRRKLRDHLEGVPHILQWRTKGLDSFAKKISRPEKAYERFEQITDLSGLRVLTYTLGEIDSIRSIVEREFRVDETEDKGKQLKPNQLGYRSVNYVVSLPESLSGSTEWKDFASLKAEIQVDTILSHVWSELEHPLYKEEMTVPAGLRRRLFLTRGLLEVADLELQDFKEKSAEISAEINVDLRNKAPVSVSVVALSRYLERSDEVQELVALASKVGFDIMSSLEEQLSIVTDLADACYTVGIHTIDQLEGFLKKNHGRVENFLRVLDSHVRKKEGVPWSVGGAYIVLFLLMAAFPSVLDQNFFAKRKWSSVTVGLIRKTQLS